MIDSETITRNLVEAANIFNERWQHARLIFRREVVYRVDIIDHLGKIVDSGVDTRKAHCDIEILGDGVMYMAMSDPSKTMDMWFSEIKDSIASDLFDMSLTQTICNVEWSIVGDKANIIIYFADSQDGQTNIDAEAIDAILSIVESKYGHWHEVVDSIHSTRELTF